MTDANPDALERGFDAALFASDELAHWAEQNVPALISEVRALRAALASAPRKIVSAVSEMDDRTSPEDWPDAMLVTANELEAIARAVLQPQPQPKEAGE